MTAPSSTAPSLLDIAALDDLKDMLDDALAEIIRSFLDGLPADVAAVEQGLLANALAVRAAAHSLKGSSGNLGARALAQQASDMEQAALAGDMATCQANMQALATCAQHTQTALEAYLAQP